MGGTSDVSTIDSSMGGTSDVSTIDSSKGDVSTIDSSKGAARKADVLTISPRIVHRCAMPAALMPRTNSKLD